MRVNVYKDQVNNVGRIPLLPGASRLLAALAPSYWRLNSARKQAKGQPLYATPGSQLAAVQEFMQVEALTHNWLCILSIAPLCIQ